MQTDGSRASTVVILLGCISSLTLSIQRYAYHHLFYLYSAAVGRCGRNSIPRTSAIPDRCTLLKITLQNSMRVLFFLIPFTYLLPAKSNAQKADQFDGSPLLKSVLNEKIWITSKDYYLLTKASDSTVHLYWGNGSFKRKYYTDLDIRSAEKIHVRWTNKNYLIVEYGIGSGAWVDIALPIDKKEKTQEFYNGIYFDEHDNLIVSENAGDTILIVQNLETKRKQFIIEKGLCCSPSKNVCVGVVTIKKKVLYTNWTPDNCTNDKGKTYQRKITLKI